MDVGDRIKGGRWLLDAKLATGGFSVVFAASHRNGSRAAIKVLDSEFTEDEDMRRRFLREGYAANKVGHEGVVRILDDDTTEDGRPYLVMELLEGEPLDRRRDRLGGKLPLGEVLTIADELLAVLAAAHEHGIIHRDIKPANVFMTRAGRVKVLDFGFAKVKEAAAGESTAIGTLLGTPGFLPPERAQGLKDEVDARSDVWSAGATLFTLLSGAHVHAETNPVLLIAATAQRPARSLESVAPGVPRAIIDIIDRALAFEKADRWASASEMQAALREVTVPGDRTNIVVPLPAAREPMATTVMEEADQPLPRLYDDIEDGGSKGFTQVLPSSQVLQRPIADGPTQILRLPLPQAAAPPSAAAPPPVAPPPLAPPRVVTLPARYAPPKRKVWPLVVGSALALLGVILGLVALFGTGN